MSADGAHLGVSAGRALKTILGGEPSPSEDEQMDAETFRAWITSAPDNPPEGGEDGYSETARLAARYLLEYLEAHPEDSRHPLDNTYDWSRYEADGWSDRPEGFDRDVIRRYMTTEGVWDRAAAANPRLHDLDLTGFMVGWAYNAARRCLEMPPAPNPALLTVEVPEEQA